jgi:uncharacterized protein (UPF0548 family)
VSFIAGDTDRRLAELARRKVNYDPDRLNLDDPPRGWAVDTRRQQLPSEAPGDPVPGGPWEIAARLIRGYEFADPSLVRARYDPDAPLLGRDMVLQLRALGLVSVYVGVRVAVVWDETRQEDGRDARVWGWAYRTLEGHVEQGQMGWQVWKWLDSGEVEFRAHAVSRTAKIANPVLWVGFHLLKRYERHLYLDSTDRRMRELTARALGDERPAEAVREASSSLTARSGIDDEAVHDTLAGQLEDDPPAG